MAATRRAILSGAAIAATLALLPDGPAAAQQRRTARAFPYADADRCQAGSAFVIANRSRSNVLEVYIRPSGTTGWGEDRLGEKIIEPTRAVEFEPGQGVWDVLIVRADGKSFLAMRQNACRISRIEITSGDALTMR